MYIPYSVREWSFLSESRGSPDKSARGTDPLGAAYWVPLGRGRARVFLERGKQMPRSLSHLLTAAQTLAACRPAAKTGSQHILGATSQ